MRVAYVQTSPRIGDLRGNLEEAWTLIEKVREADLVVLPELFHSGYAVRSRDESLSLSVSRDDGGQPLLMCVDACQSFAMNIVGGFLERDDRNRLWNSAWLIGPEGIFSVYRKINLFDSEKEIFERGNELSPITRIGPMKGGRSEAARVAMAVCFDWIFPDLWGRLAWGNGDYERPTGAQVICHPANLVIPDKCPHTIRSRAMENRIFIVTAGRVGVEDGPSGDLVFRAGSRIVSPDGTILSAGPENSPGYDMITIDPVEADNKYVTPRNHVLRERYGTDDGEEPS